MSAWPNLSRANALHKVSGGTPLLWGCVDATLRTSSQRLSKLTAVAGVGAANVTRTHSLEPYNLVVV